MSNSTILTVGVGQEYHTIAAAIAAANGMRFASSIVIQVTAGTYVNDGGTVTGNAVSIQGVGGVVRLVGGSAGTGGAAALATAGNYIAFTNLDVSGVSSGAGILVKSGNTTITNVSVHDNKEGIVAQADPNDDLAINNSQVFRNGTNIDVGSIRSLGLNFSGVHDAQGGDEIRSVAERTSIDRDVIADNAGDAAYAIDLPNGGNLGIESSTIEKGPNSSTSSVIFTGAGAAGTTSVSLNNSTFINDVFPNTDGLLDRPVNLRVDEPNQTWNLPNIGSGVSLGTTSTPFRADSSRPAVPSYTQYSDEDLTEPTITTVTGNPSDGGVTISGKYYAGLTVTVADATGGNATILGTAVTGSNGKFAVTSHAKLNMSTLNIYTVSGSTGLNSIVTSMPGALYLTDTGADHLTSDPAAANVFAVMSFKGVDIIDSFKTTAAAGSSHDVLDFSGRGITNFAQVQAMMSGSASTVLTMAGGKTITLEGVSPTTLSATDFTYS